MDMTKGLKKHLKQIIEILEEEKRALVQSDGDRIMKIVERKNQHLEELEKYKGLGIDEDKSIMNLIKEIDSLQELNLLLTRQALDYQNALLESLAQGIKNASNTYSAKGDYGGAKDISLVDHSV